MIRGTNVEKESLRQSNGIRNKKRADDGKRKKERKKKKKIIIYPSGTVNNKSEGWRKYGRTRTETTKMFYIRFLTVLLIAHPTSPSILQKINL